MAKLIFFVGVPAGQPASDAKLIEDTIISATGGKMASLSITRQGRGGPAASTSQVKAATAAYNRA